MEVSSWLAVHWFDLVQTICIVGGFLLTAYTIQEDAKTRRISNQLTFTAQHREIWKELYEKPQLARVLHDNLDLISDPVSNEEVWFVKFLIFHLNDVFKATKAGMFKSPEGMQKDIKDFFASPIPKSVWERLKPMQDSDFVAFIEESINH